MYIINEVYRRVNKKCDLFIKMWSLTSGGGTRNLTAGVQKTSKNAKKVAFIVDNPAKV
tara:strand:- start:373 stop:546 length:174 start_codon:yes stop_codon:yes gene_type:complete